MERNPSWPDGSPEPVARLTQQKFCPSSFLWRSTPAGKQDDITTASRDITNEAPGAKEGCCLSVRLGC